MSNFFGNELFALINIMMVRKFSTFINRIQIMSETRSVRAITITLFLLARTFRTDYSTTQIPIGQNSKHVSDQRICQRRLQAAR